MIGYIGLHETSPLKAILALSYLMLFIVQYTNSKYTDNRK